MYLKKYKNFQEKQPGGMMPHHFKSEIVKYAFSSISSLFYMYSLIHLNQNIS